VLTEHIDFRDLHLKRSFVRRLAAYCVDSKGEMEIGDAEDLISLSSTTKAAKSRWRRMAQRMVLNLSFFLHTYEINLPLDHFYALVPLLPLKPRKYTISSSPTKSPDEVGIIVTVVQNLLLVDIEGNQSRPWKGQCSNFMAGLNTGDKARILVRDSTFILPPKTETPIIMIGTGTGLAPMRSFMQERTAQQQQGKKLGPAMLIFGCRHSDIDFICKDEILTAQKDGVISDLVMCYSRPTDGTAKKYVQQGLEENTATIKEYWAKGGHVYICGGVRMGKDVRDSLVGLVGDLPAERFFEELFG